MVPRENKNNAFAKFGGTNKKYYSIYQNSLLSKIMSSPFSANSGHLQYTLNVWSRGKQLALFFSESPDVSRAEVEDSIRPGWKTRLTSSQMDHRLSALLYI